MLKKTALLFGTVILLHAEGIDTLGEIELFVVPTGVFLSENNHSMKVTESPGPSSSMEYSDTLMIRISRDTGSRWMRIPDYDPIRIDTLKHSENILGYRARQLISELDWTEILNSEEESIGHDKDSETDTLSGILICTDEEGPVEPYTKYDGRPEALFQSMALDKDPKWGLYNDPVDMRKQSDSCYVWRHGREYYDWKKYKALHETVKKYATVKVHLPYKVKFRPFVHRRSIGFRLFKILH